MALLPVELVLNVGSAAGFAMVFSLLASAIIWNVGTWYFGLPASSSHALIGSILGVGRSNSLLTSGRGFGEGVNWAKASEVFASLLVSPIIRFSCAAVLLILFKKMVRKSELFTPPEPGKTPPFWIRPTLLVTCTGVSFAYGSDDGQKGMGLLMLILIGVLPASFAVNVNMEPAELQELISASRGLDAYLRKSALVDRIDIEAARLELSSFIKPNRTLSPKLTSALISTIHAVIGLLAGKGILADVRKESRARLRSDLYLLDQAQSRLKALGQYSSPEALAVMQRHTQILDTTTRFIPFWVKVAVALALGLGTMIGWKRILVTVGEKIGKEHLTYPQGAAAETVTMGTIAIADSFGLPVSTTHVLSSGVAGTMAANHSGVNMVTLRSLLLAWILTFPVCVFVGAALFALGLNIIAATRLIAR